MLGRDFPSSSLMSCVQVVPLQFTPQHARSYNELVQVITRNLLLADFNDENHRESLLHKHAKCAPALSMACLCLLSAYFKAAA